MAHREPALTRALDDALFRLPLRHQAHVHLAQTVCLQQLRQQMHSPARNEAPARQGQQRQDAIPGLRRKDAQRGSGQPARRRRHTADTSPEIRRQAITRIAGKQFVAAVARQGHGHMPSREVRDQRRRYLRGVGEGLVIDRRQPGYQLLGITGGDIELGVISAQVAGNFQCKRCFIEPGLVEANGERANPPAALRLHECHHGAGIDAAREEGAQRHVGGHLQAHRFGQALLHHVNQRRIIGSGEFVSQPLALRACKLPEGLWLRARIRHAAELKPMTRRQLANATIDGQGPGDIAEAHKLGQCVGVYAQRVASHGL